MGAMIYSLLWGMQDLYHQPYEPQKGTTMEPLGRAYVKAQAVTVQGSSLLGTSRVCGGLGVRVLGFRGLGVKSGSGFTVGQLWRLLSGDSSRHGRSHNRRQRQQGPPASCVRVFQSRYFQNIIVHLRS